ncbi:MAG: serine/threonine-protein kinase [Egibacteraceae bacterium]
MAGVTERVSDAGNVLRELPGYRIERELGRGSMGVVYLAEDVHLQRKVALKVLTPSFADDERFRRRFTRESQVAANLDHAHVVPIYGAGEAGGLLYIAMRYVDGRDLWAVLQADGPLALERALAIVTQVSDALDAAHEQGLVHRDVKPANILVDWRKGQEHCYLCDFGITKHAGAGSDLTATDQLFGTYDYIAPEQIHGKPVDGRADVYALGCVLYQCLTGTVPFSREGSAALLWAHMHDEPPLVTALRPDLPAAIDGIVAKAIAKRPEDRYPTCGELALALGAVAAGVPASVLAAPAVVPPSQDSAPEVSSAPQASGHSDTRMFAPLGIPLHRRGESALPPSSPRRRWPLVVGGASALVLIGILVGLGVYARPTRDGAQPAAFPNAEEQALIGLMPAAFSERCARDNAVGAVASIRCESEQARHEIVSTQFNSPSAREEAYARRLRDVGLSSDQGDCKDSYQAEHRYQAEHGVAGRIMCYRDNGSSFLVWTNDEQPLLLMLLARPDADHAQLYHSWNELAELPPPPVAPLVRPEPAPGRAPLPASAPPPVGPPALVAPAPISPAPQAAPAAPEPAAISEPEAPTPPAPSAPSAPESPLLTHVPASLRSTCDEADPGKAAGSAASVACGSTSGADQLQYFQYSSKERMQLFYVKRVGDVWSTPGIRAEKYSAGHYLLYTNSTGQPQLEWTNEALHIYSVAVGTDPNALLNSWQSGNLGPV